MSNIISLKIISAGLENVKKCAGSRLYTPLKPYLTGIVTSRQM